MIRTERRIWFECPVEVVWEAMSCTSCYTSWWPWLRRLEAGGLVAGEVWACQVQPPLPYSLRFTIAIDEVRPCRFVRASVSGDIVGSAWVDLSPAEEGGTEVHVASDLAPAAGVLRSFARVARPLVTWGHDWVLEQGIRQFRDRALPHGPPA